MLRLEQQSPSAAHWAEQQYAQSFQSPGGSAERIALVAEMTLDFGPLGSSKMEQRIALAGFLVAQHIGPEWELENIVVAAKLSNKGIGARLLNQLLSLARETNSQSVFLEVRESNIAARKLYEKAGFQPTGRRKSYYTGPVEDALLYRRNVP
jgi:ribosomal-protein-alanine N-acetyltransferase